MSKRHIKVAANKTTYSKVLLIFQALGFKLVSFENKFQTLLANYMMPCACSTTHYPLTISSHSLLSLPSPSSAPLLILGSSEERLDNAVIKWVHLPPPIIFFWFGRGFACQNPHLGAILTHASQNYFINQQMRVHFFWVWTTTVD